MSDLEELRRSIPTADIAAQLGVSEDVAAQAIDQAVPTLLAGLHAQDTTTAPTELGAAADNGDGQQIVSSLFGNKTDEVAAAAAGQGAASVTDGLVKQLLPILAPIVISFVMQKLTGQSNQIPTPAPQPPEGQAPQQVPAPGQNNGDLLGGILGGMLGHSGNNAGAGNVLGGILGGILGGRK